MDLTIRECGADDLALLCELSRVTYGETFGPFNTPANMAAYLEAAFAPDKLQSEVADRHSSFYFLFVEATLAGYLKLNEGPTQTDLHDPQSLEIERIYVTKQFQGCGLGRALLDKAVEVALAGAKTYLWLGVWEKNEAALGFYRKMGFYEIGTHPFVMGDEVQTDYLLRKDLG